MSEIQPGTLDPVLHSGPRITIMSRLVIHQEMRFAALQKSTTLTAGNLAAHVETLVKAGYAATDLDTSKATRRKTVRITETGDKAFRTYVQQLRNLIGQLESPGSSPSGSVAVQG